MSVMGIKTISVVDSPDQFDKKVSDFLEKYEDLCLHDKTVFSVTRMQTKAWPDYIVYTAIFYGELG